MMYKFKSKAAGDVIMLKPNGDQLLALIGKAAGPQGIIEAADMPAAISALERAEADEEAAGRSTPAEAEGEGGGDGPKRGISLRQRVWPMVEMMKRSHAEGQPITWGA